MNQEISLKLLGERNSHVKNKLIENLNRSTDKLT